MKINKNLFFWTALLVFISAVSAGVVFFYYLPYQTELEASVKTYLIAPTYASKLDGLLASRKVNTNPQVVAVMIDNHPDARPQSGLSKAKIVYEAPVEGEFTRYMAIFEKGQNVSEVGPVRSARPYFLDWLQEYGRGLYMHSGGSPAALSLIGQRKIFDADEFFWGSYYWRTSEKQGPHNLLTKSENWQKILEKYSTSTDGMSSKNAWKFATIIGKGISTQREIKISYASTYEVTWKYDPKALDFVRYINGVKYQDMNGAEVKARNVLIQYVNMNTLDSEGRRSIMTVGTGSARVLKKGEVIQATWVKKTLSDRTRFYTKQGIEFVLLPGTTWVEIVPNDTKVEVTN